MREHPDMRRTERALLVSIRPRFVSLLLSGDKTVELRRTPPNVQPGALVLIYESSPNRRLVGRGQVTSIDADEPSVIWDRHGHNTGLSREEFNGYFRGTNRAVAIKIHNVSPLTRPASLEELRARWTGFRPPQSFRYLSPSQVARLTLASPASAEL
jgi:predicted transcriptional regulator